jgi:nucleotide-binding universal stress UspA family protein
MSYRTILVHVADDAGVEARLHAARALAFRFDAVLVGMYVAEPPFVSMGRYGEAAIYLGPEIIEAHRAANREVRDRLEASFRRICGSDATTVWSEAEGDAAVLVTAAAHTADLVIGGRGDEGAAETGRVTDHLVLAAGVPVLMLPPAVPAEFGKVVLVGWNGSREATRAAHDALPFLRLAERVILTAVGTEAAASVEPAAAMLRRHGVPVHTAQLVPADGGAGAALLAEAASQEADLLVMGAYGHSRFRELVFGGATRRVLTQAALPVLFGA